MSVNRNALATKNVSSAFSEFQFYSDELWDILGIETSRNVLVDEEGLEDLKDWMNTLTDPYVNKLLWYSSVSF